MIEIAFYAPGLRDGDNVLLLGHGLEVFGGVHYHVDTAHDIVYFDMESPVVTLAQLEQVFTGVGLKPRAVGRVPEELTPSPNGTGTMRLSYASSISCCWMQSRVEPLISILNRMRRATGTCSV